MLFYIVLPLTLDEYLNHIHKDPEYVRLNYRTIIKYPIILKNMSNYDEFKKYIISLDDRSYLFEVIFYNKGKNDDQYFINTETDTISRENFDLILDMFDVYSDKTVRFKLLEYLINMVYQYPKVEAYICEIITLSDYDRLEIPDDYIVRRIFYYCKLPTIQVFMDNVVLPDNINWNYILRNLQDDYKYDIIEYVNDLLTNI